MTKYIKLILLSICAVLHCPKVALVNAITGGDWTNPTTGQIMPECRIRHDQSALFQLHDLIGTQDVKIVVDGKSQVLNDASIVMTEDCVLQIYRNPPEFTVQYGLMTHDYNPQFIFRIPYGEFGHFGRRAAPGVPSKYSTYSVTRPVISDGRYSKIHIWKALATQKIWLTFSSDGSKLSLHMRDFKHLISKPQIITLFAGELTLQEKQLFAYAMFRLNIEVFFYPHFSDDFYYPRLGNTSQNNIFVSEGSVLEARGDFTNVREDRVELLRKLLSTNPNPIAEWHTEREPNF